MKNASTAIDPANTLAKSADAAASPAIEANSPAVSSSGGSGHGLVHTFADGGVRRRVKPPRLVASGSKGTGEMSLTQPAYDADIVQSLDALLRA